MNRVTRVGADRLLWLGAGVREPPGFVSGEAVLDVVRGCWAGDVDAIEYLAVGFGAHHWQVSCGGVPRFFVTL